MQQKNPHRHIVDKSRWGLPVSGRVASSLGPAATLPAGHLTIECRMVEQKRTPSNRRILTSPDISCQSESFSKDHVALSQDILTPYEVMASLLKNNPELAKEWHPSKNGSLMPADLTLGSNKKVWWICSKGHEWQARVTDRNYIKTGCPYCSGYRVCIDNCLYTINPTLAREWHPTKNDPLNPKEVTPGSSKKVWWICSEGHTWETVVSNRNRGTGCPYCAGRALGADNCLQTINSELAKQWHPTKNGRLTPKDVTPNSDKKAWWICGSGHEWKATISNRNRGRGCPYCAGRAVCDDNCLQTVNPPLAAEWHPVENGRLTPRDVTPGSSKRVWWQCDKGHAWEAYIHSRSRGYGRCPYCKSR